MLSLQRPLVVLDIEATGLHSRIDRIVEICLVRLEPTGEKAIHTFRINPEVPIPPEVTEIHGISDADVADCPAFDEIAPKLLDLMAHCDLAGYNILNFDLSILTEEFLRARLKFETDGRRIVDAQRIFHKKEPRDLTAALKFFCGEELENAHGAEADAVATLSVLEGQIERYPDLPRTVDGLDNYCNPRHPDWLDRTGRLKWKNGDVVINFGKRKGAVLKSLVRNDVSYLRWILKSDFPRDVQEIVRNAIDGEWPSPPRVDQPVTAQPETHTGRE